MFIKVNTPRCMNNKTVDLEAIMPYAYVVGNIFYRDDSCTKKDMSIERMTNDIYNQNLS